jgi:energy-coupling factor transport system permease protein
VSNLARRAHPFTPGAAALALMALAIIAPAPKGTLAVYAATCILALVTGAGRGVWFGLLVAVPLWVLLFVIHGVMGEAPRIPAPWGGTLSQPGLAWALAQGGRLGIIVTASLAFARVFDPHRFLQGAIARRWPFQAAFLVVATLDAADRFGAQARQLREAQRTRGLRVTGSLAVRIRAIPALVFPLMLATLTEAEDRALALETRGFMIQGARTPIDPPRDHPLDRAVRWLSLLLVLAVALWRFTR